MPAHNAENKDRVFTLLVNPNLTPSVEFHNTMFVSGRGSAPFGRECDDRGFTVLFYWNGHTRTWEIKGYKLPYVPAAFKEEELTVTKSFDLGLPKSQGDTLIQFLEWLESIVQDEPPKVQHSPSSKDVEEEPPSS